MIKNNNLRGDLSDISAIKTSMIISWLDVATGQAISFQPVYPSGRTENYLHSFETSQRNANNLSIIPCPIPLCRYVPLVAARDC